MFSYHVRVGVFKEHCCAEVPDASLRGAHRCVPILVTVLTALSSLQTFLRNGAHQPESLARALKVLKNIKITFRKENQKPVK